MIMTLGKLPPDLQRINGENIQKMYKMAKQDRVGQGDKIQILSNTSKVNHRICRSEEKLDPVLSMTFL